MPGSARPGTTGLADAEYGQCVTSSQLGALAFFPVRYPDGFAGRLPAARENSVVTWNDPSDADHGSVVIWFGNSFGNLREEDGQPVGHGAIDIMAPIGCPVVLTTGQRVVDFWRYRGREIAGVTSTDAVPGTPEHSVDGGNAVRTIDARGFVHYYAHLRDPALVYQGRSYVGGHVIGYVGDTGAAAGNAHLHYQIRSPRALREGLDRRFGSLLAFESGPGLCSYNAYGGPLVNPYEELVRLALRFNPPAHRRGPHSSQYVLAPGSTPS